MEILNFTVAILAAFLSVVSYFKARAAARAGIYTALERAASGHIFTMLVENDDLNELFYANPKLPVPAAETPLELLTREQRLLYNFGTIVLDYFEQLFHLERAELLPSGICSTWQPWLDECARAPHFRWVWARLARQYEEELGKRIESTFSRVGS